MVKLTSSTKNKITAIYFHYREQYDHEDAKRLTKEILKMMFKGTDELKEVTWIEIDGFINRLQRNPEPYKDWFESNMDED